jgi:phage baseplate assembly protein gpV
VIDAPLGPARVRVHIDGAALPPPLSARLSSLRVLRQLSAPAMAELVVEGPEPPAVAPGADLRIERDGLPAPLFEGQISAVETAIRGGVTVRTALRAYDPLARLRAAGTTEALSDVTPADLASEAARALGLGVEAAATGPRLPTLVRAQGSGLAFLRAETRRFGLWFHVADGVLHLHGLDGTGPVRRLAPAAAIELRLERNDAEATGSLSFAAWDPATLDTHPGFAFGLTETEGGGADLPILDLAAASANEALATAAAEMTRRDAGRSVLRAVLDGATAVRLGERLEIAAPGSTFGPVAVTRLEERIDAVGGHVVELSTEPPPPALAAAAAAAFPGRVVANDDPDGLGRVRVALPGAGDVESGWLQVVRPMTGAGRGFVFAPAVGDVLLVLAPGGRPEHGFALGALNGRTPVALNGGAGDATRFGFITAAGHRLVFDDDARTARLEVPDGSGCEFAPDGVTITAAGDLTLAAPGRRVLIRAGRIDLVRG